MNKQEIINGLKTIIDIFENEDDYSESVLILNEAIQSLTQEVSPNEEEHKPSKHIWINMGDTKQSLNAEEMKDIEKLALNYASEIVFDEPNGYNYGRHFGRIEGVTHAMQTYAQSNAEAMREHANTKIDKAIKMFEESKQKAESFKDVIYLDGVLAILDTIKKQKYLTL